VRAASATEQLVDTDVLVDHFRAHRRLPIERRFAYSVISRFELFAGRATDEDVVNDLLGRHREIVVDGLIAAGAGRLRRTDRLEIADALIAATALVHDLELVTRNRKDFERVRGIRLRDPSSLT
jgi:predicted nucleic acid-binding protein